MKTLLLRIRIFLLPGTFIRRCAGVSTAAVLLRESVGLISAVS
jgi:hypothetical protein